MKSGTCQNCGGDYAIHHYSTNQCPVGGREANIGHKQEWNISVFEPEDNRDETIAAQAAEIKRMRVLLKQFVENFEPCVVCDGMGIVDAGDACESCGGTAVQIKSMGFFISELYFDVRKELQS